MPPIVHQLSDVIPDWFGILILVAASMPALSCVLIWHRNGAPPRDALIATGVYYAITATSYFGVYFTSSGQAALLSGCGSLVLFVTGFPLAIVLYMAGRPHDDKPLDENECEHCGYNLTLNTSGQCPECGKPIRK